MYIMPVIMSRTSNSIENLTFTLVIENTATLPTSVGGVHLLSLQRILALKD